MPAVSAPAKVVVTGATGYIAAHVVQAYLEAGFTVIGTVRKAARGEYLSQLFEAQFPGKFSYAVIADLESAGALDELSRQADVIAHTASPVTYPPGAFNPQLMIGPAVNGTLNVLNSAATQGSTVKRVVITGSVVTLFNSHPAPYVYTEKDWNDFAVQVTEKQGKSATGDMKYIASKVLAERAALDFVQKNAPPFDLVHVLPAFVYGPMIHDISTVDELPLSFRRLYDFFAVPDKQTDLTAFAAGFVDVRDVARTHVDATTRQELAGRRLISAVDKPLAVQDFFDAYYSIPEGERPHLPFEVPRGRPGAGDSVRAGFSTFSDESQKALGWELRGLAETVRDSLQCLVDRGILKG